MRVLSSRSRPSDKIPSSSMADVAFLLLVFFLVTTVFPKDRGLTMVLPPQDNAQPIPADNLIQFLVMGDGLVEVRRGNDTFGQSVRGRDLGPIWREAAAQNDNLVAAVRTHPDASYGSMIDVLDVLKEANARRVSLQLLTDAGRR